MKNLFKMLSVLLFGFTTQAYAADQTIVLCGKMARIQSQSYDRDNYTAALELSAGTVQKLKAVLGVLDLDLQNNILPVSARFVPDFASGEQAAVTGRILHNPTSNKLYFAAIQDLGIVLKAHRPYAEISKSCL